MKLKAIDISRTASASSIIFDVLRKAIIEGEIAENSPLRQDEIATLFNTSRIPVREAISRLEEQGLVKTQRYKGAIVAGLSAPEAAEVFDLRALLEPEILRNAVPRMSRDCLAEARAHCQAFSDSDSPMEWGDLNRVFHKTLYSASDLKFFIEVADNAMDRVERYVRAQLVISDGMERAGIEHFAILEACEMGDGDRASLLLRDHILGAKRSLLDHFPALTSRQDG
ncbi:FCD domain-containing protein [Alphaproteobacteria bacterium GH1-50]|uniref:FCD domain-containing protein n=1 Tax=Kangsaoukella pontilimi TaxID=2691042 RepID=A0A7C9MIP3_9RHOB|nr:GntR family transcriptional regulator [Kangsaoukella pontilimi]MXQ07115.1 FCD domain-containing protein [Kangsaoukella pontilimi]